MTFTAFLMNEKVGVAIGTFGSDEWHQRGVDAYNRHSHLAKGAAAGVSHVHSDSLADARNSAAKLLMQRGVDWLIFLDADDGLADGYIEAMLAGSGDLRQPSTLGVYEDWTTDEEPVLIQPKPDLLKGNHLVVGTMVRAELFLRVGGFRELPVLEDWDLWIRCWLEGAEIGACPEAVYLVGVRVESRNTVSPSEHGRIYMQIQAEYTPLARERGLL